MGQGFLALVGLWWLARLLHVPIVGAVAGLLLVNLLPGIALVQLAGFGGRSLAWRVTAAGVLSPPLVAAIGMLAGFAGVPPERMTWPIVALGVLLLFLPERSGEAREESAPLERGLVAAGVLLASLVAIALLHPRLPRWSDSWFHAAVFHEVQRSGVHATFPHFVDMPLPYPWFFHLYLVMASPLVHADPFVLMATVNQWAAFLLPVSFYMLARALGQAPRTAVWASVAGVLGVHPFGPLVLVVRSFVGVTGGWPVLVRALADADSIQSEAAFRFPGFQTSWLARLWTPTAFNFSLVLAIFALALVVHYLREPRARTLALFGTTYALLLHWHTLTALHLSFGIAAGVACVSLWRARTEGWRALVPGGSLAAVMLLAYLAARPYLASVTLGGAGSVVRFRLVVDNVFGLVISMGPVVAAALASLPVLDPRARAWATGALTGLALPMLMFDLPDIADEKLYWPLFVLVAAVSAPAVARLAQDRRRGRVLLTALLLSSVLGTCLTGYGFLGDSRSMRTMFDAPHADRASFYTPDERAALEWIRERSPRDAVFLQPLRPAGTEPILVHGERRLWVGFANVFYRATFFETRGEPPIPRWIWDELVRREAVQRRAFSDETLTSAQLDSLRARPWPIYFWWDTSMAGGRLSPTLADTVHVTRPVFMTPGVRILELRHDR